MSDRAFCIHAAAVRLAQALILGLLLVSGYVVAPILFAQLPSAAEAGRIAGVIFSMTNQGVMLLGVAVAAFWFKLKQGSSADWVMLVLLLALVGINGWWVAAEIESIKQAAGPIDLLAKEDPLRQQFGMWHGVSAILHLLESLLAAVMVAKASGLTKRSCEQ